MNPDLSSFLLHLRVERQSPKNTQLAHQRDLQGFFQFCETSKSDYRTASRKNVRAFLVHLEKEGQKASTRHRKLASLRRFYTFLRREEIAANDPTDGLSVSLPPTKLARSIHREDLFRMLALVDGRTENGVRDRAMLEFLYATGCRVSELCDVTVEMVDLREGTAMLRGKGSRVRQALLHREAVYWIDRWLIARAKLESSAENLFLNRRGKRFSRQGVFALVQRYGELAGLGSRITPHMFRHSFATHLHHGGVNIREVQELLGHRSIATTERYTSNRVEELALMRLKYHPLG